MRDINRIPEIQSLIETIWQSAPDLRYMQLIYILQRRYAEQYYQKGIIEASDTEGFPVVGYDLFNVADDSLINFLQEVVQGGTWLCLI